MQRFLGTGFLVALIIICVLVSIPILIDQNDFKRALLKEVENQVGIKLESSGDARVSFFPFSYVEIDAVYIKNNQRSSSSNFFYADKLRVNTSIFSLFRSRVSIDEVVVSLPSFEIETFEDKTNNWAEIYDRLKLKLKDKELDESLKIKVINGSISHTKSLIRQSIDYIYTDITYDPENGKFLADGSFTNNQQKIDIEAEIYADLDEESRFMINTGDGSTLVYKGLYSDQDKGKIIGEINGQIKDLSKFSKIIFSDSSKLSNISSNESLDYTGKLTLNLNQAIFDDVILSSDSINGVINVEYNVNLFKDANSLWKFDIDLNNLHIDNLFEKKEIENKNAIDYYQYSSSGFKLSDFNFQVPSSVDVHTKVKLGKITFLQRDLTNLSLTLQLDNGKADLSELFVIIPGNSKLKVTAQIFNNGIRPLLKGRVDVAGNKLRDVVLWLNPEYDFIPEDVMNNYIISADLNTTPLKFKLDNLSLVFDKSILNGNLSLSPAKEIPLLDINLSVDRINLDKYTISKLAIEKGIDSIKNFKEISGQKSWLKKIDSTYNINLDSKNLIINGHIIKSIKLLSTISPEKLDVRNFKYQSRKSDVLASGNIDLSKNKPTLNLSIKSDFLNLDEFKTSEKSKNTTKRVNKNVDDFSYLQEIPIKTYGLGKFTGQIDLDIKKLEKENVLIEDFVISSKLKNNIADIKKFKFKIFDGEIALIGGVGLAGSNPSFSMKYTLKNIDIKEYLNYLGIDDYDLEGNLLTYGSLTSSGKDLYKMITNLKSRSKYSITNLKIKNYDLNNIIKNTSRLYSVIDMREVVNNSSKNGETLFDLVKGDIDISKSILRTKNSTFYNQLSRSNLNIAMILFNQGISGNFITYFKTKSGNRLRLPTTLKGDIFNIDKKLNINEIEDYITSRSR